MTERILRRPAPARHAAGTGLQKINLLTAWAFAAELGTEAPFAWNGPFGDDGGPTLRAGVLTACNRLKRALGARGDLAGGRPFPEWPAYGDRFAYYCPPGPLLTDRAELAGILLRFAAAAVDLSGAALLVGEEPSPLASRGASALLAGLSRIQEWYDGTRPRLNPGAVYDTGNDAIRFLNDVCSAWPAVQQGERIVDPRGFHAVPDETA